MTVLSALLPAVHHRVRLVTDVLPSAFPAAATTGSLAVGTMLVLLAHALRRGTRRAWLLAVVLVSVSAVLHLVKGLDVEEALAAVATLTLLVLARTRFVAPAARLSLRSAAALLVGAPLVAGFLGWLWLTVVDGHQELGTTSGARLAQAFLGLVGVPGPVAFIDARDREQAAVALAVLGAGVLVALVVALLMPPDGPPPMSDDELEQVRSMVTAWGHVDSLSYFATRGDRSLVLGRGGRAGVTYRVVGRVSLAAGDPVGDPDAWSAAIATWLDESHRLGRVPAVLGASERGVLAYHRAGLDALEMGDEAVIRVEDFGLSGRAMRGVRQAVSRCVREGLTVTCDRLRDLTEHERREAADCAVAWRDGPTERGFSMALGRVAAAEDPDSVVVRCRDSAGRLRALLTLVPWGRDGLSLDLMRRDRTTVNGVVEHMVAALCSAAPGLGVERVSLNFAMFRSVFARGERLGAGPVLRVWHRVLLAASRYWQIESLYRANAKYRPAWHPRYLCFARAGDLPRIATAALRAEAFLVLPGRVGPVPTASGRSA
jgi:lysyl-tRNA synthetase class 2